MIAHYIKKSLAKENTPFDVILCDYKVYLFENNICKIVLKKKIPKAIYVILNQVYES
jgi:hypothetical protein